MLVVIAVPVVLQNGRNLVCGKVVVKALGVQHKVVVGYTAVLRHLLVVGREEKVCLVAVAEVGAIHRVVEVGRALVLVVAASVDIVEVEAHAQSFARVHAKLSREMVLAVCAVSCRVVCEVCERRQRVGEMECRHRLHEIVVRLCEEKLSVVLTVNEHAVYAWRADVAQGVVFASETCPEDGVHEHVGHGVELCLSYVSKAFVHGPHLYALRNLLVGAQRVGVMLCRPSRYVSVFVHLVERVKLCPCHQRHEHEECKRYKMSVHQVGFIYATIASNILPP